MRVVECVVGGRRDLTALIEKGYNADIMRIPKWERTRYVGIKNLTTGKGVVVDMFQVRHEKMKMTIFAWAEVMKRYRAKHDTRMVMIGLTYRKVEDYQSGHIRDYLKDLKRHVGKNLIGFAWVCELQARGAPHYHIVLVVNKGSRIPLPDESGMWSHGSSSIVTARTPYYLVTYVGKEHQKDLARYPKGCRLYAASVRTQDVTDRQLFRSLAGLEKPASVVKQKMKSEGWEVKPESDWSYAGSSYTLGYVKDVVLQGFEVK
jgi:hypothetical protein